ncbi:MAG: alanine--tRNA ligase [Acidimicrobiales bacterium]
MDAAELRSAFTGFYAARGHTVVPSASLIPHDPTVLFTIAGMVPFKPYFLGDEIPPYSRATTVQKCFRTVDIDIVGTTTRHLTFFEMLGNFSFGDYFKKDAIPFAWQLFTETLGIEADRLWVTVYETDDEAADIWTKSVGVSPDRVQRMGEDNFWKMGDTGPCGPCSELYYDKGEEYGPGGGPAYGGDERYIELYNLVFMQYNRSSDGTTEDLPRPSIDTGAGLERVLPVLQQVSSPYDTTLIKPVIEVAESLSGTRYGTDPATDRSLRVLADHARAMTMLVTDGVLPSNEGRGYVLRRVIRRAVLRAQSLGVSGGVTSALIESVASTLSDAYPAIAADIELVKATTGREEEQFLRTLDSGMAILESELAKGAAVLSGDVAFRLHDTNGFPIDLTVEIAGEHGVQVDTEGFEKQMALQRERARSDASKRRKAAGDESTYRELLDESGPTRFTGYEHYEQPAVVVAVFSGASPDEYEVILDRTPFYAESGGQVGDTGAITTETGRAVVYDTQSPLVGMIVHKARIEGQLFAGQDALAVIDAARRESLKRNHTGTHLLHSALRRVLGDHVRQQGSYVAADRLRFDFSHNAQVQRDELEAVTALANEDVITDDRVETLEMSRADADATGAVAFFGDKYGERVRVVRAGSHSTELCGGTHVGALGMIGPVTITSESSIGAGTRRIEAVTGAGSLALSVEHRRILDDAAHMLRVEPEGLISALEKMSDRQKQTEKELAQLRSRSVDSDAAALASEVTDGVVIARRDGLVPDQLRDLAQAVRKLEGVRAVVLGGSPDGEKVAIAIATDGGVNAGQLVKRIAQTVGGGGGGSPELAVAGGRDPSRIDDALREAFVVLGVPAGS